MAVSFEIGLSLLAATLEEQRDELVDDYVRRLRREAPDWTHDRPELGDTVHIGARESIGAELRAFRSQALPESCPASDAEGARQCARLGVPLHVVVLQYQIGHAVQWDAWFRLVERNRPTAAVRQPLLQAGSEFFFAYADRLIRFAIEHYTSEREILLRSREQHRVAIVRALLDGRDVDPGVLAYRPSDHHVGLVASGEGADKVLQDLATLLDRRLLAVRVGAETWWGWLGGDDPLAERAHRALRAYKLPHGVYAGVGDELSDLVGFRTTHQQASVAHASAIRSQVSMTLYDAIALEVLATGDVEAARSFIARELRGLHDDQPRSRRLRQTLRAYFDAGNNAAAAAAALGVHQQTVGHRLRAVEDLLGRPLVSRRVEIETALRLRAYLKDM